MGSAVSPGALAAADKPAATPVAAASSPSPSKPGAAASAGAAEPALSPGMPGYDHLGDKRIYPRTPPPSAGRVAQPPAAGTSAAAASSSSPPAPPPPPTVVDPMDRLQQRLAEKLGARMAAAEAKKDGELRLVARPAAGEAAAKPGAAASVAAGRAAAHASATGKPAAASAPLPWDYDGPGGPPHWPGLKSEYALCGRGERQSPIDIRDGLKLQLDPLQFAYQAGGFRVIDNGRTVRVNVAGGNHLEVMGGRYELKYFQFHHPSEMRVDGKSFDMSVDLVHEDAQGRLAVVAVPLRRGDAHPAIQSVWNNLPLEKHTELAARSPLDPAALLPADKRYATFMGSMTSPPCQEGVLWMVMKTPATLSDYQLSVFSRLYPMNARPVQPANGRMVKESE